VLVFDRLAALMLFTTAVLASAALLYACRGDDRQGLYFHPLFQFQLLGINGAFLTGDLFNLFVFFEILLIASYALLLHGHGAQRSKAGQHYLLLNLLGSGLFLIAVGTLFGMTGSLNMADMAQRIAGADADSAPVIAAGGLLLLLVFALKAALLPVYFWLPRAYAQTSAPVAALFAIMTKVGIYSIIRVYTQLFGNDAGLLANLAWPWLLPLALATILLGSIGALAAHRLQKMVAYLVVVSAGTLLAAVALNTPAVLAGALYYLLHSTWIAAGLFLLVDMIAQQRGTVAGELRNAPPMGQAGLLGGLFFIAAIAVAGLPPLSGFIGKLFILQGAGNSSQGYWLWAIVLLGSLLVTVTLARAGTQVFWRVDDRPAQAAPIDALKLAACIALLACSVLLVIAAAPLHEYLNATSRQLLTMSSYLPQVLAP
jgi:multicomponent K+:H+ antiporter subunit D